MMYYYGNSWGMPHSMGLGLGMGFLDIILWVVLIYFFVRLLRSPGHFEKGGRKDALDILKERYAKGEMDKEKYESMKKDLSD